MRYLALATDYDGTLATHGLVDAPTLAALERFRASGRKLVMVTGRALEELQGVCPRLDLFDRVVAENGALLYRPADGSEKVRAERPPDAFIKEIKARGAPRVSVGRSIVATWEPYETTVLEVIREMGLELQVIFNKGAVMVLPSGVNKATGLDAALDELGLSPRNVVGVGDAENDHAFLARCECGAAVANALPLLKERADLVTAGTHGAGVVEVINGLLDDDLAHLTPRLGRHSVLVGCRGDGDVEERLHAYGPNVLVAGPSRSGKSLLAAGLLERLNDGGYQPVAFDPEGDLSNVAGTQVIGTGDRPPTAQGVLDLLQCPRPGVVVNLRALPVGRRTEFFEGLLPRLQDLRARTGRPHWIAATEAHHLLPAARDPAALTLPRRIHSLLLLTAHPDLVARAVLDEVDVLVAVGDPPGPALETFCRSVGLDVPDGIPAGLGPGEALLWRRREGTAPVTVRYEPPRSVLATGGAPDRSSVE
jgi:HAD superfamily hydrolase (TIGR01484 family)